MQREVISVCPVCESQLYVTRLHCNTCGTTIEGEFNVGRFANLERDQMLLLEAFLRSRGNLRELERELGVSYPTVRNRVEALLRTLGLSDGSPLPSTPPAGSETEARAATAMSGVDAATRRQVLERLARKEISAEDAAALLRGDQPPAKANVAAPKADSKPDSKAEPEAKAAADAADADTDPDEDTTIVRLEDA